MGDYGADGGKRSALYRNKFRGYSLMELALVLVIIAILAGSLRRGIRGRFRIIGRRWRLGAGGGFERLRRARQQSTAQQVAINGMDTYQIVGMADMEKPNTTYSVNLTTEPYRVGLKHQI